ncbi:uncharacterized protein [Narcine bancroftii]|uniref:uncharacterized protein isoform X4 n=1 Tax=Narcine bancroftii TaxID=1343680 RepID=UPI0038320C2D
MLEELSWSRSVQRRRREEAGALRRIHADPGRMYKLFTDSAGFEHGNLCQWDFAPLLTVGVGLHPPVTFQDAVQLSSSILVYHTKEARPLSAVMSVAQKMVWRVDRATIPHWDASGQDAPDRAPVEG